MPPPAWMTWPRVQASPRARSTCTYAGKEDLFKAVVRATILPVIEQFRRRIEQATGSSEQLLADVLEGWWSCFSKPQMGGIMKLILGEASNFPEIARFSTMK